MLKYFAIVLVFMQISYAEMLKVIDDISELPKEKNTLLMFSMQYCPYCNRQESSIIKRIKPKFTEVTYLKVMKGSKAFDQLIKTGNFGEVEYFPTTFILTVDPDGTIYVKYPFKGWQRSSAIIDILNNKEIMED